MARLHVHTNLISIEVIHSNDEVSFGGADFMLVFCGKFPFNQFISPSLFSRVFSLVTALIDAFKWLSMTYKPFQQ